MREALETFALSAVLILPIWKLYVDWLENKTITKLTRIVVKKIFWSYIAVSAVNELYSGVLNSSSIINSFAHLFYDGLFIFIVYGIFMPLPISDYDNTAYNNQGNLKDKVEEGQDLKENIYLEQP